MIPSGRGWILGASSSSVIPFSPITNQAFRWGATSAVSWAAYLRSCWFSLEHDPQVIEIAAAFQFTPSEVAVYYLRANRDTERTRRRFEKARRLLDGMSDVE